MNTMLNYFRWAICCLAFSITFIACEQDPNPGPIPVFPGKNGVFILCEGTMGVNTSGISYYDFETQTTTKDILNGTLGDTGNDMILYGSKIYVAVNGSSTIVVIDPETKTRIKQLSVKDENNTPRYPRRLASYNGKVYITNNDGYVVRMDTTSLSLEAAAKVGPNPEGIAVTGGKLYVANSGDYMTGFNNTLSIVDIASFKEIKKLTVGLNPYIVLADKQGDIYLCYRGNYNDVTPGFQRIRNEEVVEIVKSGEKINMEKIVMSEDVCYFYGTYPSSFGIFQTQSEVISSNSVITDGTVINIPYGIGVNPSNNNVYISDTDYSNPGKIYVFGTDGKKKFEITNIGINPSTFVFY